ncbi:MAG TPA: glycosyltransferase family 4 protein [Acidimicrobiales bacterium]|nr:glycosyltransferase family 4 protein [Acidimicrobiales bacterium]
MKLAVTHPYSWPEVRRGAERIIVETARTMAARGHHVTILTSGSEAGRSTQDGVTTVKFRRLFTNAVRHERWFGSRIVPSLLLGRFDAVHSMMPYDALGAIRTRRLTGHRVVYEELGNPYKWYFDTRFDGPLRCRLVSEVDVYGCMSNYTRQVLMDEWGRGGELIPGGVRLSEFTPAEAREERPTILFSGALDEPRKGLGLLLEAAELLMGARPDLQLWLSGPGNVDHMLAKATDRVRAQVTMLPLGDPKGLSARYATAWLSALPSVGDSFGMVLIETLASGTPIVVCDDAAPPQLVTPETGAVAVPNDAASLAAALEKGFALSQDPKTAARCREFARQFDWDEAMGPLLERLYWGPL